MATSRVRQVGARLAACAICVVGDARADMLTTLPDGSLPLARACRIDNCLPCGAVVHQGDSTPRQIDNVQ